MLLSAATPIPSLCRLLHDDQKESGLLPILARLIKQFDHRVQSRDHAHDLVQCLHVVLRMLERLGREGTDERFASVAESLMLLLILPVLVRVCAALSASTGDSLIICSLPSCLKLFALSCRGWRFPGAKKASQGRPQESPEELSSKQSRG